MCCGIEPTSLQTMQTSRLLLTCQTLAALAAVAHYEQIVKKSRFVAVADRVRSVSAARAFVREHAHPKAHHNVFAYRLANGAAHAHNDAVARFPLLREVGKSSGKK